MTDRQVLQEIDEFKSLITELEISSIEDIPELDDLADKFKNKKATLKDAWFAKLYKGGLDIPEDVSNAPEMKNLKQLSLDMQKRFPPQLDTKASPGAVANQIKNMKNVFTKTGISNILNQVYSNKIFIKGLSAKDVSALKTAVEEVSLGLGIKKQTKSKIFKTIPTDEMVKKVLRGIADISDQETKRLILLSLFGTRGAQINDLASDYVFGQNRKRPYYDRELGAMVGGQGRGRKKLAARVPFGPFMKDVMDYQYDIATDNGKNLGRSIFSKKLNLGTVINKYLFNKNGVPVLSDAELAKLGRENIGGFTDLRRMMLSWAANALGDKSLAKELLTHGPENMDKSVTGRFYIPDEGTDVNKLRAFTTGMEQNIARLLGYNNYQEFMKELKVEAYTTETSKVKNFGKRVTIVKPESKIVQGNITQPDLITQGPDLDIDRQLQNLRNQEEIIKRTKNINEQIKSLMATEGLTEEEARARLGIGKSKKVDVDVKLNAEAQAFVDEEVENYNKEKLEKEKKLKKAASIAKKIPGIAGAGLSAYFAVDYALKPKEAFAEEAWGGFLANQTMVKGATVAAEATGAVLPVWATMLGLGTEQEMIAQREEIEKTKNIVAQHRETYPVAPSTNAPAAGFLPHETAQRAREGKKLDLEKEKEYIDRARFIKRAEEIEDIDNLGFLTPTK